MSEYRKEGATLEPIVLDVAIAALTPVPEESIDAVVIRLRPFHFYGRGRTYGDTVELAIASDEWTLSEAEDQSQTMRIIRYIEDDDLAVGFYEYEVRITDNDGKVLPTPSGRQGVLEVRQAIPAAPAES